MSQHVYARVSGFGWTLLPEAPFRFERVPHQTRLVLVEHSSQVGPKRAMLDFTADVPTIKLGEETERLEDVLELLEGPDSDHWRIETTVYSIRWPDGFAVCSSAEPPGFDLAGPNGTLISLQGPFDIERLPLLVDMAGPGQSIHQLGSTWVELNYLQDRQPWRQTHRLIEFGTDVVVVSSQSPVEWDALVNTSAIIVAESLEPQFN